MLKHIAAGQLDLAYLETGTPSGTPVILLHGFPYDVHSYEAVAPILEQAGLRVFVPYLRGFGPTRFLSAATPRSGQQAAVAHDLLAFMDALQLPQAVLAGYDWGGRAACIVAALWPERARGLVTAGGYAIQDIAAAVQPLVPDLESRLWYQYYFHSERGRAGLGEHRYALGRLLWEMWSPTWNFDEQTYAKSAAAFDNPDFVDVVIHSYRHRFGLVAGDPACEDTEIALSRRPAIAVPTVSLDGAADGVNPPGEADRHRAMFSGPYRRELLSEVGHNVPQEAPAAFAHAVLELARTG
jgi:pimeloyl-ACP methyl ester carboxylesterase